MNGHWSYGGRRGWVACWLDIYHWSLGFRLDVWRAGFGAEVRVGPFTAEFIVGG